MGTILQGKGRTRGELLTKRKNRQETRERPAGPIFRRNPSSTVGKKQLTSPGFKETGFNKKKDRILKESGKEGTANRGTTYIFLLLTKFRRTPFSDAYQFGDTPSTTSEAFREEMHGGEEGGDGGQEGRHLSGVRDLRHLYISREFSFR